MIRYLLVILLLITGRAMATNYYVSNAGSDAAAGTSTGTAWQTIAKVNSVTFASGDSILFRKGDTFYGAIVAQRNTLIYSSYGTGAKPIITGFNTVASWTSVGGGIYKASTPYAKNSLNVVTLNGVAQPIARTPNTGYNYYTSANSSILSYNFTGSPSYIGATVIWFLNSFDCKRARIVSQTAANIGFTSAGTINPSNPTVSYGTGTPGYGFIIQNAESCLDQLGEWRLDSATKELRMYFGAEDPTDYTVQVSGIDTLINYGVRTGIKTIGLQITGGNKYGIYSKDGGTPSVIDCDFQNNTLPIWIVNSGTVTLTGNDMRNNLSMAATVINRLTTNMVVDNNTIDSSGMKVGLACFNWDRCFNAITADGDSITASNTNSISGNTITNSGACGIDFQMSNITIENNLIKNWLKTQLDEAAIYTVVLLNGVPTKTYRNRIVRNNICDSATGATDIRDTNVPDAVGVYFDDQSHNIECYGNTISNVKGFGIQCNTPNNITVRGNTLYNDSTSIGVGAKAYGSLTGNRFVSNITFQTNTGQEYFYYSDANLALPVPQTKLQSITNFATVDSQYTYVTKPLPIGLYINPDSPSPFSNISLATWEATYGHDVNSVGAPVAVVTYSFTYNATATPTTVLFPGQVKRDMQGATYTNSATLDPYTSIILIDTGVVPPIQPGQRAPMFFRPANRN